MNNQRIPTSGTRQRHRAAVGSDVTALLGWLIILAIYFIGGLLIGAWLW